MQKQTILWAALGGAALWLTMRKNGVLPTSGDLVERIAQAIARMEGFFVQPGQSNHPTIAQRNNNPGNLRRWGSVPIRGGFAHFPTAAEGWAALRQQIRLNIGRGLTLYEFFAGKPGVYAGYAPAADNNNPQNYALFVGRQAGIPVNVPMDRMGSTVV